MKVSKNKIWLVQLVINLVFIFLAVSPAFTLAFLPANGVSDPNAPRIIIPTQPIPGARPVNILELHTLISIIANVMILIGPVILVIGIIISALMYMKAGGNPEAAKKALVFLKNNLIGGFIIFGVGVIINTIAAIVTRQFFCPTLGISFGQFGNVCF